MGEVNIRFKIEQNGKSVTFKTWNDSDHHDIAPILSRHLYEWDRRVKTHATQHLLVQQLGEAQVKRIRITS
jgi:hypothetical protein